MLPKRSLLRLFFLFVHQGFIFFHLGDVDMFPHIAVVAQRMQHYDVPDMNELRQHYSLANIQSTVTNLIMTRG